MQAFLGDMVGAIAVALLVGAVGAALAFLVRLIKGEGAAALLVGLESFLTTAAGAILAWLTLSIVLAVAGGTNAAAAALGTLFMIWPGLVDVVWAGISALFLGEAEFVLFNAAVLPWYALAVGAGIGLFDGYRRIHRWTRTGILGFVADVTWGLPLATNALVMHFVNLPGLLKTDPKDGRRVSVHEDVPRVGNHRYLKGFRLKKGYAFTQGSVISNLETDGSTPPSSASFQPLLDHEQVHVFQNRVFGPLFWFTYMFWLIVIGLAGLVAAIFARPKTGNAAGESIPFWWAYMSNPWEVWAYQKNRSARDWVGDRSLAWPAALVIGLAIPVFGAALVLFLVIVVAAF